MNEKIKTSQADYDGIIITRTKDSKRGINDEKKLRSRFNQFKINQSDHNQLTSVNQSVR